MIGILTCGLPLATRAPEHPNLRALGVSADPDTGLDAHVVDVLSPALRRGATIVAIVPEWGLEPILTHLHVARSGLDTTRLVIHRTALPPLAAGVFALTVAELARRGVPDGPLVSHLPALERHVVGAAWLGSVARLREPAPGLGQHARSYLPGTAFGAVVDDRPRVVALRRHESAVLQLPSPRIAGGWRVTIAEGEDADTELVRRTVTQFGPDTPTERADLTAISIGWWGTAKLVELALVPADHDALATALTQGVDPTRCPWCDELVAADPCPFCGVRAGAAAPTLDEVTSGGPA